MDFGWLPTPERLIPRGKWGASRLASGWSGISKTTNGLRMIAHAGEVDSAGKWGAPRCASGWSTIRGRSPRFNWWRHQQTQRDTKSIQSTINSFGQLQSTRHLKYEALRSSPCRLVCVRHSLSYWCLGSFQLPGNSASLGIYFSLLVVPKLPGKVLTWVAVARPSAGLIQSVSVPTPTSGHPPLEMAAVSSFATAAGYVYSSSLKQNLYFPKRTCWFRWNDRTSANGAKLTGTRTFLAGSPRWWLAAAAPYWIVKKGFGHAEYEW